MLNKMAYSYGREKNPAVEKDRMDGTVQIRLFKREAR